MGNAATYWGAEEPAVAEPADITVSGKPVSSVGGLTSITIPSPKSMNTLAWQDAETGIYYRLQSSVFDMEIMTRIAEYEE